MYVNMYVTQLPRRSLVYFCENRSNKVNMNKLTLRDVKNCLTKIVR